MLEPPVDFEASTNDNLVIFCIDISGSMCVTTEIQGKLALKGDHNKNLRSQFAGDIQGDQVRDFPT